jgi:predicted RNA-binding protein with PIN domain
MPVAARPDLRRTLDEDDDFRARVAVSVDLTKLDAPSRLFLVRPESWEIYLEWMAAATATADASRNEAKAEQTAQKKLKAAEQARGKAEARVQETTAELDRVRATLEQECAARRQAETTAHSLTWEIDNLRVRVRELEEASSRWNDERAGLQRALANAPSTPAEVGSESFDASGAVAALGAARDALSALERALASLEAELPTEERASTSVSPAAERRSRKEKHARRSPSPLPGGVHDTSDEAARHLVSLKHVVLLVDGYNVAMRAWPDLTVLADQRARLLDRLAGLHATKRTEVVVVFDGTASGEVGASKAQPAHVVFTSTGVTDDEEILRRIQHIPRERPVVVATSDREVAEGARRNGANSISAEQLLAVI